MDTTAIFYKDRFWSRKTWQIFNDAEALPKCSFPEDDYRGQGCRGGARFTSNKFKDIDIKFHLQTRRNKIVDVIVLLEWRHDCYG